MYVYIYVYIYIYIYMYMCIYMYGKWVFIFTPYILCCRKYAANSALGCGKNVFLRTPYYKYGTKKHSAPSPRVWKEHMWHDEISHATHSHTLHTHAAGKTLLTHAIARETGANFFNISAKNLDPGPAGSGRIKYPDKKGPNSAVMMLHMVFKVYT